MKLTALKTNRIATPLGFALGRTPAFSWIVEDTDARRQSAARVVVSLQEDLSDPVFDTGRQSDLSSLEVVCTAELAPRTRYYWSVTVWADNGETASAASWFETGKLEEPWQAEWIAAPQEAGNHPLLARDFVLDGEVTRARLYCTGLGLYEAELNGSKAGDEYLTPDCNNYNHFIQVQTYDVTDLLHAGKNRLGFWLGKGWYAGRFGFLDRKRGIFGDELKLLAELVIELADGRTVTVVSDDSWRCHTSPITESGIYDGEWYDARLETDGWSTPDAAMDGWAAAVPAAAPDAPLTDRWSLPIKIMQRWPHAELLHTPAGEWVVDFQQEMTGWVEFDCDLPAGAVVQLQFGELLQHGNFYNDNLRTAKEQYTYISSGRPAHVRPHFTFYGFRYMKVTGIEPVDLSCFHACVLYSDMESTGSIETSNPKVNRLIANVQWGQRGNFVDVPTDCPQRDERLGWTGDAEVFSGTANFNMDTAAFYSKYLHDMLLDQLDHNGGVPHVVPDILSILEPRAVQYGSCAWGDAGTIIPWNNYLYFGSRTQLQREYENMKRWTDYIKSRDDEVCGSRRLWLCDFHFADWLAMDNPVAGSCLGGTDAYYVASGYYYWSAHLTAKAAAALGKTEEAVAYAQLAEQVLAAIREEFFTPTGRLAIPTQTALAMSLYMGLAPQSFRARQAADLAHRLDDRKGYLDTGFVGTYQLCSALSENGLVEKMYTLLLNEELPSWLYEVNMGATTIWERWNSVLPDGLVSDTGMNSMNHYAYGAVMEWMYRYMCGLNPVEEAPGFKKARIRPMPDSRFDHVRAVYRSAAGRYVSGWKQVEGGVEYEVEVPFDAEADFILPAGSGEVLVNGVRSASLTLQRHTTLYAGRYCIRTVG